MEFPNLQQFKKVAYDTETTGLQYKVDKVFGFSVSTPDGRDYYYDIRQTPAAINWINDQFRDYRGIIICHNTSFDVRMSSFTGITVPLDKVDDTVIRACLINEHEYSYGLDALSLRYLGEGKYGDIYADLASIFGGPATRNTQIRNLQHAPPDVVAPYAKTDTRRTLDLHDWQDEEIVRQGIQEIVAFELDLLPTFIRQEMRGIRVDLDYAEEAMHKLTPFVDEIQTRLNKTCGGEFNVNSSPQVKALFKPKELADGVWVAEDGTPLGTTPKGQASVNAEILREMDHPAAKDILELRSLLKTRDTFLAKHVLAHAVGDYVYPNINQNKGEDGGTGTGRVSYSEPAMQQIPSRNKVVAAIVKPCFLPPEGLVWCDCDEASFEVRTFADLVGNEEIINAYHKDPNLDLHQFVADITGLVRNATYSGQPNAKQLNLSMIFNSGNGAIAEKMGMPWTWESFTVKRGKEAGKVITYKKAGREASDVIDRYHARIPGVKELAERDKNIAEDQGYLTTYFGRRLRFPNGFKSYKASGIRIQATAADLNKENWKLIEEQLDGVGHLILNTHDSYGMALPEDWKPHYERVRKELETKGRLKVPLILDWSGVGYNWHQALQGEDYATTRRNIRGAIPKRTK